MSNIEYELRALDVDQKDIESKLRKLGARYVTTHNFRRHVYEVIPQKKGRWVRLRTNGKTTTLTIKQISADTVDGTQEWETSVDDFEQTHKMLELMGLRSKGYQENTRVEYSLDGVEVCIDQWPDIPAYVEFESSNEERIYACATKLGFRSGELTGMNTEKIYLKHGIDISNKATLEFKK